MRFNNVELKVRTKNPEKMAEFQRALDWLDVSIESDYIAMSEEFKKKLSTGEVECFYCSNGAVDRERKGNCLIFNLSSHTPENNRPFVKLFGLEKLGEDYEISYCGFTLHIIKKGEHPCKYTFLSNE